MSSVAMVSAMGTAISRQADTVCGDVEYVDQVSRRSSGRMTFHAAAHGLVGTVCACS